MKKITTIMATVFLFVMVMAAGSMADTLTGVQINHGGPVYNNWYTEYYFKANELGEGFNRVFCVENADVNAQLEYELVGYTPNLELAAKMADAFYNGGVVGGAQQSDYQIAIWYAAGVLQGAPGSGKAKSIFNYNWSTYELQGPIALLNSPPGSAPGVPSQNFLINRVAVPEPTMAMVLGGLLAGVGVLGRRQFLKR